MKITSILIASTVAAGCVVVGKIISGCKKFNDSVYMAEIVLGNTTDESMQNAILDFLANPGIGKHGLDAVFGTIAHDGYDIAGFGLVSMESPDAYHFALADKSQCFDIYVNRCLRKACAGFSNFTTSSIHEAIELSMNIDEIMCEG